ncbi:GAD-like domain-containing protein [Leeia aquatica]|uniref:DUF1851 domain-containing protein n=1 Tax=Leeia aquatica TaxID=2725557 RepID=A0A847S421_9NEIS|nr:GAD-like domain-containing protein [Leeia aquatica]NLR74494.1 DUF1851 domain-containing protein [Leeia aquatica]
MGITLQAFVDTFEPGLRLRRADPGKIAQYQPYLPDSLLELWRQHGFGVYGDGLIQIVDPDDYRDNLWDWLMRDEDMSRLPIAISAFGDIFYYRKLSDAGDEDVCYLDPHTSEGGVLVWSLTQFFNEWCCNQDVRSDFFRQAQFEKTVKGAGILHEGQMYFFVPALRLGGGLVTNIERGAAAPHLHFLLELTQQV